MSIEDPKIILALSSISCLILSAASVISTKLISGPPETLSNNPLVPSKETLSNNGFEIADSAASTALLSPAASPCPNTALPISDITALTSAKSRFIKPGCIIKSVTDLTPACKTWSHILNASDAEVFSSHTMYKF